MATRKTTKKSARKEKMPEQVAPMLCTLTRAPADDDSYLYEIKWDGYRMVSHVRKKQVTMLSRSGLDYTAKYPPVKAALLSLNRECILDGEVVVLNEQGMPDFDALQRYNGHNTPITYVVFDLLWLDGKNLMHQPLTERKAALKELLGGNQGFLFSESFEDGPGLYQEMLDRNLEGIVAKKKDSAYEPGARNYQWLKTPTVKRQEFVVGGWAESDKSRAFKSLLFGAYHKGRLEWIGRSGGGFKDAEMPGILKKLKTIEVEESPFNNKVLDTKGAVIHWVKPELVANFSFATWTKSGRIRKPATFLGFRKDKKAKQVVREVPKTVGEVEEVLEQAPKKVTKKASKK